MPINPLRIRKLNRCDIQNGSVVYWMSRDQRVDCNWALVHAQEVALERKVPLSVLFCLQVEFLGAGSSQFAFMLQGLKELSQRLAALNIPFTLLLGDPEVKVPEYLTETGAGLLVADFSPLRISRSWKDRIANTVNIPLHVVDAHNIVPCWVVSDKKEYAAHTFRRKINRIIDDFLDPFPQLVRHPFNQTEDKLRDLNVDSLLNSLTVNRHHYANGLPETGEMAAKRVLNRFLDEGLGAYATRHNDPNADGQSGLSPYLHFGQLSAQQVALELENKDPTHDSVLAFREQLVVRRELSDNFCYYEPNYDSVQSFADWATKTLKEHRNDPREFLYRPEQFEQAETHDPLWNAAQLQMVKGGVMHGYMRMYWAKKILEWTESAEEAMTIAIYLNDKYQLDGRDPNGYTGIAWSIGGVHDRAWAERPVFGKIRFMNDRGCRSKFNVQAYMDRHGSE